MQLRADGRAPPIEVIFRELLPLKTVLWVLCVLKGYCLSAEEPVRISRCPQTWACRHGVGLNLKLVVGLVERDAPGGKSENRCCGFSQSAPGDHGSRREFTNARKTCHPLPRRP